MEPEQQDPQHQIQPQQLQLLQQQQSGNGGGGGGGGVVVEIADGSSSGGGGGNKSSFLCRQSSTRWTPTTDQIRILKDLYYNNGVRSPTGEQIQRISARLRQYGKIEGKNVFYWFQNHKARERQKKRFTVDMAAASMLQQQQQQLRPSSISISAPSASCSTGGAGSGGAGACGGGGGWKQYQNSDHYQDQYTFNTKYQNITQTGVLSCPSSPGSSQGIMNVNAQTGSISTTSSYGSMLMEKSFRDCSISSGGCSNLIGVPTLNNNNNNNNLGWIGTTHHEHHNQYPCPSSSSSSSSYYPNFVETNKTTPIIQQLFKETSVHEVETLPLFPMNDKDENVTGFFAGLSNPNPSIGYTHYPGVEEDRARTTTTSLELTLSSSSYISPNPN